VTNVLCGRRRSRLARGDPRQRGRQDPREALEEEQAEREEPATSEDEAARDEEADRRSDRGVAEDRPPRDDEQEGPVYDEEEPWRRRTSTPTRPTGSDYVEEDDGRRAAPARSGRGNTCPS
jgi:hypothetical protein